MKAGAALVWKEWHELRWFLWVGLGLFLVYPFVVLGLLLIREGRDIIQASGIYTNGPSEMVTYFGGLAAVFIAVAAACRDLRPGLQTFWQSRPIGLGRWLGTKYLAGLVILLLVCGVPLSVQWLLFAVNPRFTGHIDSGAMGNLLVHTFGLAFIYSISFLLGCLVRHTAHAAILSVAAVLLIYFLPVVLPPLGKFMIARLMDNIEGQQGVCLGREYFQFVTAMLAGSGLALAITWLAVRRDWRLALDLRLMCWMIGGVVLILFASTAFQLASNLTCERRIWLCPESGRAWSCAVDAIPGGGSAGLLVISSPRAGGNDYSLCRYDLALPDSPIGPRIAIRRGTQPIPWIEKPAVAWSPEHADRAWCLKNSWQQDGTRMVRTELALWTVALDGNREESVIGTLDLLPHVPGLAGESIVGMALYKSRIYVACYFATESTHKIIVVDVQKPDAPVVSSVRDVGLCRFRWTKSSGNPETINGLSVGDVSTLTIPAMPGLTDRERLDLGLELWGRDRLIAHEGDLLVVDTGDSLAAFRLAGIEGDTARYRLVGRRIATPLERLDGGLRHVATLHGGLLYVLDAIAFPGLTVYDVRQPERPKRLGHYSAAEEPFGAVIPLPDGRVLAAGVDLHILKLPGMN